MLYQLSYARALPARPSGGGRIRTFVGRSRQIYSLLPLTARAPHQVPCRHDRLGVPSPTDNAPRVSPAGWIVLQRESSLDLRFGLRELTKGLEPLTC
jgi:hypothetical protein